MPQLDFIIAFSQIFWLIVVFLSSYIILIHFFLPTFVKVVKARKEVVDQNIKNLSILENEFNKKQLYLNKIMILNFSNIKIMLEKNLLFTFKKNFSLDSSLSDKKIADTLSSIIFYYDLNILESIPLRLNI